MTIHKVYRADGKPDLTRWQVSCDTPGCASIADLIGSTDWLLPAIPAMPGYCPTCWQAIADFLIGTAISCPACGCVYLTPYINELADQPAETLRPDQRWPHHIDCQDCGHIVVIHDPNGGAR